jgi:hypothetical protein
LTKEINRENLPCIQETLKQRARKCSQQRNYGKGQQCSLMNDLEGTYAEIQMLKKNKEKTASM